MDEEVLRGRDYLGMPLIEVFEHPDFNRDALRVMILISSMSSEDIAKIDITDWKK